MLLCIVSYVFLFFLGVYIFSRLTCGRTRSNTCLVGKTVLIVGATQGIGYKVALGIASRGARLIIADVIDTKKAVTDIKEYTQNQNVFGKHVDLASFKSIREFVKELKKSESKLDILINNSGIGYCFGELTEDGLNKLLQINLFGPFLLTHLLVDLLKKSSPSRIIFTSSCLAFKTNVSLENCENLLTYGKDFWNYGNSKLAVLMISDILAKILRPFNVTCNAVYPGFVTTGIFRKMFDSSIRENDPFYSVTAVFSYIVTFLFGKDPWEGSQTTLHVALSKNCAAVSGEYFWDCRPFWKPSKAYDQELCEKIWEISLKNAMLTEDELLK